MPTTPFLDGMWLVFRYMVYMDQNAVGELQNTAAESNASPILHLHSVLWSVSTMHRRTSHTPSENGAAAVDVLTVK